jgi:hypothetical protein
MADKFRWGLGGKAAVKAVKPDDNTSRVTTSNMPMKTAKKPMPAKAKEEWYEDDATPAHAPTTPAHAPTTPAHAPTTPAHAHAPAPTTTAHTLFEQDDDATVAAGPVKVKAAPTSLPSKYKTHLFLMKEAIKASGASDDDAIAWLHLREPVQAQMRFVDDLLHSDAGVENLAVFDGLLKALKKKAKTPPPPKANKRKRKGDDVVIVVKRPVLDSGPDFLVAVETLPGEPGPRVRNLLNEFIGFAVMQDGRETLLDKDADF